MKERFNKFTYTIRRFWKQTRRLIKWAPVIWNSYDWDYSYAIDVFKLKLEETAAHMESDKSLAVNSKHYASRIRMVLRLMDKVYNGDYELEYSDKLKEKWGNSKFVFNPVDPELYPDCPGCSTMDLVWEMDYTDEELKQIEVETLELMKAGQKKQKRAHKLLWELIEHNVQHWWD